MKGLKQGGNLYIRLSIFFVLFLFLLNCSAVEGLVHLSSSTGHFKPLEEDRRVLYEDTSKSLALEVSDLLPGAIRTEQERQFGPYQAEIKIYVCESRESFHRLTGRDVRALTYRGPYFFLLQWQEDLNGSGDT